MGNPGATIPKLMSYSQALQYVSDVTMFTNTMLPTILLCY